MAVGEGQGPLAAHFAPEQAAGLFTRPQSPAAGRTASRIASIAARDGRVHSLRMPAPLCAQCTCTAGVQLYAEGSL